jgi:hypothetical protein
VSVSVKACHKAANWPLAASMKKAGVSYPAAIAAWVARHLPFTMICLVSFYGVEFGEMPKVYVAGAKEIGEVMNAHSSGRGHGALHLKDVPAHWKLTAARLAGFWEYTGIIEEP